MFSSLGTLNYMDMHFSLVLLLSFFFSLALSFLATVHVGYLSFWSLNEMLTIRNNLDSWKKSFSQKSELRKVFNFALVPVGKVIFFILPGMMQCSGFRRKAVLITHQCFSCFWVVLYSAKDVSVLSAACAVLPARGWEDAMSWEGTKPRQMIWAG